MIYNFPAAVLCAGDIIYSLVDERDSLDVISDVCCLSHQVAHVCWSPAEFPDGVSRLSVTLADGEWFWVRPDARVELVR